VKEHGRRGFIAIATLLPSDSSEHLDCAEITWFYLDVTQDCSIIKLKRRLDAIVNGYLHVLVNNA
jgi:1-acylglycerone phosphate reductase